MASEESTPHRVMTSGHRPTTRCDHESARAPVSHIVAARPVWSAIGACVPAFSGDRRPGGAAREFSFDVGHRTQHLGSNLVQARVHFGGGAIHRRQG